jgi:hypothetical protein
VDTKLLEHLPIHDVEDDVWNRLPGWKQRMTHVALMIPFRETRLIVAHLLHDVLRLGHSAFAEMPFMEAVQTIVISTAIFAAESKGEPFSVLGLSRHLQMPRATLHRRLAYLESKGIVTRDGRVGLNPQMFKTPTGDENIRRLRQLIIDAGVALSKLDA